MTYVERQAPQVVTRAEVRQFAELAHAILDGGKKTADLSAATRKVLRNRLVETAKDVAAWCDGALNYGEHDAAVRVIRMVPLTFECKHWYRDHLAETLDLTPQAVLDANPIYVEMLKQMATFIDDDEGVGGVSTEARLETLAQYEDTLARLASCTEEYEAEIEAEEQEFIERSTNNVNH